MIIFSIVIALCVFNVDCVEQNVSCPVVSPLEVDLKSLDGKWYLAAVATELELGGDCAMVVFNHKRDNTTDVSISWITNNTASFYNGSVALSSDPNSNGTSDGDLLVINYMDHKTETFNFLDIDYEHYALMLACDNSDGGDSSTYEIWELTRAPHAKPKHKEKIFNALSKYSLQNTSFITFNNLEAKCKVNGGSLLNSGLLTSILTSATALSLFRRMY